MEKLSEEQLRRLSIAKAMLEELFRANQKTPRITSVWVEIEISPKGGIEGGKI
jgi:hypothetical protein